MTTRPWHGSVVISTALRNPSATLLESELDSQSCTRGSDFEALDWDCEWRSVQRSCSRLPGQMLPQQRVGHRSQLAANPEPA
ncbi:unnamed protein product [Gadus morhua 'NCC']